MADLAPIATAIAACVHALRCLPSRERIQAIAYLADLCGCRPAARTLYRHARAEADRIERGETP